MTHATVLRKACPSLIAHVFTESFVGNHRRTAAFASLYHLQCTSMLKVFLCEKALAFSIFYMALLISSFKYVHAHWFSFPSWYSTINIVAKTTSVCYCAVVGIRIYSFHKRRCWTDCLQGAQVRFSGFRGLDKAFSFQIQQWPVQFSCFWFPALPLCPRFDILVFPDESSNAMRKTSFSVLLNHERMFWEIDISQAKSAPEQDSSMWTD